MLSFITRSLLLAIAASGAVQAATPHNNTITNGNSRIKYYPSTGLGAWSKWPYAGCLDTTGGMWTSSSGPLPPTVSLTFTGTDIWVYGQFDDETSLPIYTVTVDGVVSDKMGSQGILHADRCKPIYSKNGLDQKSHTVVFTLTTDRPNDIRDLAFDGFIYTTTDASDTGGGSTTTSTPSTTGNNNTTNIFGISLPTTTIVGIIVGVVCLILALALGFVVRRRRANAMAQTQMAQQPTYQPPVRPASIETAPRPTSYYTPPPQAPYVPPPIPYVPPQPNPAVSYNMAPYQYNNAPQPMYAPPPIQPPWSPPPNQMAYEQAPSPWNPNLYHTASDSNSHLLSSTTPSSPYMGSQGQPAAYFDQGPHHRQPSPGDSYSAPASSASPQPTVDYQAQHPHNRGPAPLTDYEVDAISQRVRTEMREGSLGGENVKSSYAPVTSRGDGSSSSAPPPTGPDPAMYLPRNDERPQRQGNQGGPDAPPTYH